MSLVTNDDLVAMMHAMMVRLDAIEARLEAQRRASQGALQLAERPEVARVVDLVADNSEIIGTLLHLLAQSPGTLELVTQSIAGFLAQRDEHGRTLEQQLTELMLIAKRVTQPSQLAQVHTALDLFEANPDLQGLAAEYLQGLVRQLMDMEGDLPSRLEDGMKLLELATRPGFTGLALQGMQLASRHQDTLGELVQVADSTLDALDESELDLATLSREGIELLELAAKPENLALARKALLLVGRLDGSAEVVLDLAGETLTDIQAPEFHFEERARTGLAMLVELSDPDTLAAIRELTRSGMMDPAVLELLARVGAALQRTTAEEPGPIGMFSALGALRSEPTLRSMGFALAFSEQLGEALAEAK